MSAAELSLEDFKLLEAYRAEHGRNWKSRLTEAWLNDWAEQRGDLRRIRNNPAYESISWTLATFDRMAKRAAAELSPTEGVWRVERAGDHFEIVAGYGDDTQHIATVPIRSGLVFARSIANLIAASGAMRDAIGLAVARVRVAAPSGDARLAEWLPSGEFALAVARDGYVATKTVPRVVREISSASRQWYITGGFVGPKAVFHHTDNAACIVGKPNEQSLRDTANARQIAAAPLLFDALHLAVSRVEIALRHDNEPDILRAWLPDAKAALAAALNQHPSAQLEDAPIVAKPKAMRMSL